MREIKFRAWYNEHMIEDSSFYIREDWQVFNDKMDERDYILMQYTWIKDKNWKEIYEWDLLSHYWDTTALFEIFYNDDLAKFDCCRVHYSNWRCGWYIPPMDTVAFEAIWNIYENPELLNNF